MSVSFGTSISSSQQLAAFLPGASAQSNETAAVGTSAARAAAVSITASSQTPDMQAADSAKLAQERAAATKQPAAMISNGSNITMRFRVDEKTGSTTIYLVDRTTKRVLRSIPSGEMSKLSAGEIVRLSA